MSATMEQAAELSNDLAANGRMLYEKCCDAIAERDRLRESLSIVSQAVDARVTELRRERERVAGLRKANADLVAALKVVLDDLNDAGKLFGADVAADLFAEMKGATWRASDAIRAAEALAAKAEKG